MSRSPDPFLILGNSAAKGSPAPKGRNIPAQGNALGSRHPTNPSPEGAEQEFSTAESPQGWRETTFGELIRSVSINDKKLPAKQYGDSGKFPVVDQGQKFIGGYTDDEHRVISDELPLIVFGDHTRIFKYLDRAFVPGADGIKVLKPIGVDAKWLFHIAHALDFPDKGYARHFQHLKQATVFVPPLPEQRRIVARIEELFSRLDAGVAALRHAKAQLQRYRQSVLAAAVTGQLTQAWREQHPDTEPAEELLKRILEARKERWKGKYKEPWRPEEIENLELPELPASWKWTTLNQLTCSVKDGPHYSPKYADEGIPFVSGGNVRPHGVDFDGAKRITPELHEELSKRCKPELNDILYTKGGTTGIARVNTFEREFNVWVHVAVLRLAAPEATTPFFVQHTLNSPFCYGQSQNYTHGVGNQDLGLTRMIKIVVPLPPTAEQHQIVAEVEARTSAIDHLEAELDRQITCSNRLRQSTLASAFAGTL